MFKNETQNEKEAINEIIIELKISNNEKEKEINILCDKEQLIKDNEEKENFFIKKIILYHQKNLIILIKIIQNYI